MSSNPTYEALLERIHVLENEIAVAKQTSNVLEKIEERYNRLSENLQIVVYTAFSDKMTSRFIVSGHMEALTGYPAAQFKKDADLFARIIHPEDRHMVTQKICEALEDKTLIDLEYRIITQNNQVKWIRDKAFPADGHGNTLRVDGFLEDITNSRRSDEVLRSASKLWQDTFNAMSEALAIMDADCRIVQCNRAMRQLVKKSDLEIIGRPCWEVVHGTNKPIKSCPCTKVKKSRQRETIIAEMNNRRFEVDIDPQFDEHGEISGYIHIMSDITERDQAAEAQREAYQTFLTVLDSIDASIYVADMETYEIIFMNRYMRETFDGDFTGQKCWQAFRRQKGPCSNCTNDQLMDADGNPTGACVWEGRNAITGRWYVNYDRAIKWMDRRYVHLRVATDITEIKSLEQERQQTEIQLRQAQKMEAIGTLAGGIAHDFNNILSAVLGYSELALDDAANGRISSAYLRQILQAGHRARDLVQQILTFSRQTETEAKPIQVKPIIKEALKLLRASLPSTIEIRPSIQSEAIVAADPIQVHQVIMNLCTNAGHAMRQDGGILTVELMEEDLPSTFTDQHPEMIPGFYLKLAVSDTGQGIDPDTLNKIFDPYFTTKSKGEGTGMGLAVVQGIVQSCGGTVVVSSTLGEGARFTAYLPIIHTEKPLAKVMEVVIPGGNERILCVDDEPPLAELNKQILERLGYHVTVRTSSTEAALLFERRPDDFDLVITDMTMPHMTGDVLAQKIMAIRPEIPIVICTGYSEKITQEIIDNLKIRALVMKPIIRKDMALAVRQVLDDAKDQ